MYPSGIGKEKYKDIKVLQAELLIIDKEGGNEEEESLVTEKYLLPRR